MRTFATAVVVALLATTSAIAAPLAADTPSKSPAGATFTAPAAWTLATSAAMAALTSPEGDLRAAIVDVGAAADARAAAAAAWARFDPAMAYKVEIVTQAAPKNGWDERQIVNYDVPPAAKAVVQAVALRKGAAWTVLLVNGAEASFEKRLGAAGLVSQSLRPAGYSRESFAGRKPNPLTPERIALLREFVRTSMDQLGIPGAGLAVIENGRVLYEGGVGVRDLVTRAPVTAHTRFMIASNTKGMATLLLATLADDGKLRWDQPVTALYPAFKLGDEATTRSVQVKHLVCACTGLPRKDLDWIFNTSRTTPASTTFKQLAATQPTSGFGEVFQYNNLMASAAGYVGAHLLYPKQEVGAAFDRAMNERVFTPLGMRETTFNMATALGGDYARPYALALEATPALADMSFNYVVMPYRPAGGAWSTAHDMIRYVHNELSGGVALDGRRVVSRANLLARRAHGVPTSEDQWYGMGLESDAYWGVEAVHHGGSMFGYKSDWVAVPDAGVGAVLLTNSDEGQAMLRPFRRRLLEILYDGKPEAAADVAAAARNTRAALAVERAKVTIPPDPAVVARLAPRYTNADLGTLTFTRAAGGLTMANGNWRVRVATRKNADGTVSLYAIDPGLLGFDALVGPSATAPTLTVRDSQHEYIFKPAA